MSRFAVTHDAEIFDYDDLAKAQDYFVGCIRDKTAEFSTPVCLIADQTVIAVFDNAGLDYCENCGVKVTGDTCAGCG